MRALSGLLIFFWLHGAYAETEWEKYLDNPTSQQAARVNKVEVSEGDAGGWMELQILQNQVLAQDVEAFRLAYRLYGASDGGLAEDMGVLIARTIRPHPQFFLQQIKLTNQPCSAIRWVLNTPGPEYIDRGEARRYEIEMRKKALRSVTASELIDVRDACLKEFR